MQVESVGNIPAPTIISGADPTVENDTQVRGGSELKTTGLFSSSSPFLGGFFPFFLSASSSSGCSGLYETILRTFET